MANLTEDELAAERRDEAERCALLAEELAGIHEANAAKFRREGAYTVRAVWPLGAKVECIRPAYEREAAKRMEAVHSLRVIAEGCRKGWDPRKLVRDKTEDKGACYCDLDEADCTTAGHPVSEHNKNEPR